MMHQKKVSFSNLNRKAQMESALKEEYELLIIGGGVTGAGIALDAALRGIKTILIEKQDFASGTSSKSTKLIHGGLRYLKQLEFGLVRESGLERSVAHRNIPHLVHPEKMLLPIVKNGSFGKFSASIAISVYDLMASVPAQDRKKSLSKKQVIDEEPLLNRDILKSGILYSEYRTDDARLTMELIKAAKREGATIFNYLKADGFEYVSDRLDVVNCTDMYDDAQYALRAKQVVSAAGPWVDILRDKDNSKKGSKLRLTKGVHIVFPKEKFPLNHSVYFDAFDGRMIFAIPRGKVTYLGTSDTVYDQDLDRVVCTDTDVKYLLKAVNQMFDVPTLSADDVISTWAGLRPLIHEAGKSPSELSRKDEIFESKSGLISIAGGKLTGYRKMAQRIVDLVQEKHKDFSQKKCTTRAYRIAADSFETYQDFEKFHHLLLADYEAKGITSYDTWYLSSTYGKEARRIIDAAVQNQKLNLTEALILSEIDYCLAHEAALMPDDFFNRRTGRLYFDIHSVQEHFKLIQDRFSQALGLNNAQETLMSEKSRQLIDDVLVFSKA